MSNNLEVNVINTLKNLKISVSQVTQGFRPKLIDPGSEKQFVLSRDNPNDHLIIKVNNRSFNRQSDNTYKIVVPPSLILTSHQLPKKGIKIPLNSSRWKLKVNASEGIRGDGTVNNVTVGEDEPDRTI